jgi:pheromone receptor transcription factor
LSTLTGTQVLLLVASETGHVYTFATPKLQPLITKQEGKNLIQACLNSPDHHSAIPEYLPTVQNSANSVMSHYENDVVEEDLTPRSGSTVVAGNSSATHGYLPTGTTPTPPAGSSAASVAAAAAQVFMNSGQPSHYVGYAPQASSGNYWNGGNPPATGMYTPIPAKPGQQSQQQHLQQLQQSQLSQQSQQQQQQQQQMYHALMQQQQLFQQYQQHQNQSNHHNGHDNADS